METLTTASIITRAHELTDVEDPCPQHFMANLEVVIRCMNEEASLTSAGVAGTAAQLVIAARNRIEVDRYLADHPDVGTESISAPIFLTGLPRSGTTYFQYLFDQDPSLRMMRTWEGDRPVPPPALDSASVLERRTASAEAKARVREQLGSKMDAMHLIDIDGPQECLAILDQTYINPGLLWMLSAPGYLDYLLEGADLISAYQHHSQVLRLLQQGAPPRRWALKWPCHLLALDAIAAVYPDARFVVTHRDPVQALASNCSLASHLRVGTSPHSAPEQVGRDMLELVRRHVDRLVAFDATQSAQGRQNMIHVDYYDLVANPETVMPDVFTALGLDWTDAVEQSVVAWRSDNPQGKRGRHDYTLEEYGLDRGTVAEAFSAYTERFAIPSEYASA